MAARRSWAWTLTVLDEAPELLSRLSWTAFEGFEYAEALAKDARASQEALWGEERFPPLRVADLAVMHEKTPAQIRYAMSRARLELFGDVSDRTIRRRLARRRELARRPQRTCDVCGRRLPPDARASRRTCSGRCRTRKQRRSS